MCIWVLIFLSYFYEILLFFSECGLVGMLNYAATSFVHRELALFLKRVLIPKSKIENLQGGFHIK